MSGSYRIIRASAGTGKTFALSSQLLSLIVSGESPEKILATTFTRKAAGEILSRVYLRLAKGAESPEGALRLSKELGVSPQTPQEWGGILRRLINVQHRLSIRTMDSVAVQIAKVFGLDIALPSNWRIIDDREDRELRDQALFDLFSDISVTDLLPIVRRFQGEDGRRSIHEALLSSINVLYQIFLSAPQRAWESQTKRSLLRAGEIERLSKALNDVPLPLTGKKKPAVRFVEGRDDAILLAEVGGWEDLLSKKLTGFIAKGKSSYYTYDITEEVKSAFLPLIEHARSSVLIELEERTKGMHELLALFHRYLSEWRWSTGGFRFDDLKRVLRGLTLQGGMEHLYFRLDAKIRHVLLDEFQDTSREEWDVISPFAEEVLAGGEGRTFFCVGDVKQAIYRWRGGVAEVFDAIESRWPHLTKTSMEESRRSAPEVISCINSVFSSLSTNGAFSEEDRARAAPWTARFKTHTTVHTDQRGYVRFEELPCDADGDGSDFTERVASKVEEIAKLAPELSIGVLYRKNREITALVYELRHRGLSVSEEGASYLTDSPPVELILSLLTFADHPDNTIAHFHVASSLLGERLGITPAMSREEREERARAVREELLSRGYLATIGAWGKLLEPLCSARDRERLSQLGLLAAKDLQEAALRPSSFVDYVRATRQEASESAQIRVMTIHKSKGLEFDVVVFADLEQHLVDTKPSIVLSYRSDPLGPIERIIKAPSKDIIEAIPELKAMYDGERAAQISESLSVLYVALTRARRGLFLFSPGIKTEKVPLSFDAVLRNALPRGEAFEGSSAIILFEAGSMQGLTESKKVQADGQSSQGASRHRGVIALQHTPSVERVTPRIAPSSLEGGEEQVSSSYTRWFGVLMHRFLQQIEWSDGLLLTEERVREWAERVEAPPELRTKAAALFFKLWIEGDLSRLLSKESYRGGEEFSVWRERPFAVMQDEAILTGMFDRVVLGPKEGKISSVHLIDFKFLFEKRGEAFVKERLIRYESQIALYRTALAKMTGVLSSKIVGTLVALYDKGVVVQEVS